MNILTAESPPLLANGDYQIDITSIPSSNMCDIKNNDSLVTAIDLFICGIESLLENIGLVLTQNALVIATIFFGVTITSFIWKKVSTLPWFGRIFRSLV